MAGPPDAVAVAARFGLGARAVLDSTPSRGELGAVWRLRTEGGSWAIKRGDFPMSAAAAEALARFHEAAIACGVPAARVVRDVDGRVLAGGLLAYEWVELAPPSDALDPVLVGTVLARLHVTPCAPIGALDEHYSVPVPAASWDGLVAELVAAGAPFAERLGAHRPALADAATLVRPPTRVRTCHRDLFADNLRSTPNGTPFVIDFDNAGLAGVDQELGFVLWEFARSSPERAAALYDAYVRAGGPGRVRDEATFSMIISVGSRLLYRSSRRWLDHPDERAVRAADVELWLADPAGRPVVERLLAATRPSG